jgi:UDP-GlcNAc:undecaprenyl-phosphate/decaprenyl-phosphate GlcNAc-1-phosphate transferase
MVWLPSFAFIISALLLWVLVRERFAKWVLDKPNERSLHTRMTPRTGGLGLMVGVLAAWWWLGASWIWLVLPIILMLISMLDDIKGLPARWRFLVHCLVCGAFIVLTLNGLHWLWWAVCLLGMVWMVNLYNFMDGSDGLASGMGLFGFSAYAIVAWWAQEPLLAIMSASVAASCLAFLLFNFHPARIFMGDVGSVPLGYLAGAIGLYGWQLGLWPIWFPLMVFSPFIMDATVTLLTRLLKGEVVWQAHRSHYYQRLVQLGWGHRKTAIAEYLLMVMVSVSAVLTVLYWPDWAYLILAIWIAIYIGLMLYVDIAWASHQRLKCS